MIPKKRILFIGEGVTLSHIVRPLVLAKSLNPDDYEILFACDGRYQSMVEKEGIQWLPIDSMSPDEFLKNLSYGKPLFNDSNLKTYVQADLAMFDKVKPDLVVGDFRVSLGISAPSKNIPYACLINIYWSPFSSLTMPLPELPLIRFTSVTLAKMFFKCFSAIPLQFHIVPFNQLRREYGLTEVKALKEMYTAGTWNLYLDLPSFVPMYSLPANHQYLGPVCDMPSLPKPDWWGTWPADKPVVYLSFGSSGDISLFEILKKTLSQMDISVLMTTAGRLKNVNFPPNFYVADYFSGLDAAAVADLFITNGGSGAIYQALSGGVPVLGFPSNMDQFFLTERLTKLKAGILIRPSQANEARIQKAISTLLNDTTYKDMAASFGEFIREYNTKARFQDFIYKMFKDQKPKSLDPATISREDLLNILKAGLKAATPYNLQPFEFQWSEEKLFVYPNYQLRGFLINPKNVVTYSLGAFLENLSEGARHWHYKIETKFLQLDVDPNHPLCEIKFHKSDETSEYPIDHVMQRYTNRKDYSLRPVAPEILKKIQNIFQGQGRSIVDITKNKTVIDAIVNLEEVRIANFEFNEEIYDLLCMSPQEAEERRRGLDLRVLEFPAYVRWFLMAQRNPYFHRIFGRGLLAQWGAKKSKLKNLCSCPLLVVFVSPENSEESCVQDWIYVQRILNFLHREGLSAQLVGFTPGNMKTTHAFFIPSQRKILEKSDQVIKKSIGVNLISILILLRIGYAEPCQYRSLRMDPEKMFR